MPKSFGAGQMIELVAFDRRTGVDDGYGNVVPGPWQEQFRTQAKFIRLKAGETVMAGRLESHAAVIIQIWASSKSRQIGTDWQARDVRRGTVFNVRDVSPDPGRQILDVLGEQGVNTG